ncbi:LacI family DNA-binding transcriptional regulator [Oricola sp.]|uniref:LacI family DNA-binding transcriptional regulator n=1 Tax=Oricola sp. TaxID=1979950 RepID=UPI0025CDA435|nr:LacI family DNA-binding transcriptional regulator [Oricola sp.]MCI5078090.1 LacI family transcriptional regulator [Oricola sp.]
MEKTPRIKDIAAAVGVSPATVSRALTGTGLVAEPTLTRIRDAAASLGYRPNVSARNLRTQRSMAVLMVVRDVGNPFYLEIFKGVEAAAREAGYSVLMGNTEDDPDREAEYFEMLGDGHADGMILMTGKLPTRETREAAPDRPVVVALEMIEGSSFPHVLIDNEAAAREAVEHLIGLGHTRIAHVTGPIPEGMSKRRLQGYRQAMENAGLAVPEEYEARGDFGLKSGQDACARLMSLASPPTAIFTASDSMAFGVIGKLSDLGMAVPGKVSVMGFDDLFLSEAFQPPLSTVCQPRADIGREAMTILLQKMTGGPVPADAVIMPTTLQIRGTTAPPTTT